MRNPVDYRSRHPVSGCGECEADRNDRGIPNGKSDEILIHHYEELVYAVTIPILKFYTGKDLTQRELYQPVKKGISYHTIWLG